MGFYNFLIILILINLSASCGKSGFFGEVNSARIDKNNLNSESIESTELESTSTTLPPSELKEAEELEEIDEEITAIRPVVISGSYLACTVPANRQGSIICSFQREREAIDLSMYKVSFVLKRQHSSLALEHSLRDDKLSYEISSYPEDIVPTKIAAIVEIEGTRYPVNELQVLETKPITDVSDSGEDASENEESEEGSQQLPPSTPVEFGALPEYSKCSDIKPSDEFDISAEDIVEVSNQGDLENLNLTTKSLILIEVSGGELLEMDIEGVDQIRGICIISSGDSVLVFNTSAHVNKIMLRQSSGSSMTSFTFSEGKVFNSMAVDIDGGGTMSVVGDAVDCQKVTLTRVKGGSNVLCSNNP